MLINRISKTDLEAIESNSQKYPSSYGYAIKALTTKEYRSDLTLGEMESIMSMANKEMNFTLIDTIDFFNNENNK